MRWTIKPKPDEVIIKRLQNDLGVDQIIATLLAQRDITSFDEAKQFFRPSLKHLHNPFLMKDMDKAVERIEQAITNKERILVYGDYDVDGTTAVSLMYSFLQTQTELVSTYIPDRYDEGYGVSFKGIDYAKDNGFSLIIALDCGIKAIEKVDYANTKHIDFIICDHHRPGVQVPNAVAVLDPKQDDCNYPYKELCGCGVGFKLIQALAERQNKSIENLQPYLDLVAIAIGADIVPITGENRVLAYYGLKIINSNPRPGIKAIIRQIKKEELNISDVVFIIAPRINAAGRMKHGNHAVALLTETDKNQAEKLAIEIEAYNANRKDTDKEITNEALEQIYNNNETERKTTVVYSPNWHKGVIGIVASRLIETFYRPTLVFTRSGDKLAASARSVSGFDVYNALEACSEYIEQFGGHKYAAGLTLHPKNYKAFKQAFEEVVSKSIDSKLLIPELKIDQIITLSQINGKLWRILKQFAPFGPGNMTPVFMSENLRDTGFGKCVGEQKNHLRLTATDGGREYVAIGFGMGEKYKLISNQKPFSAVYSIDENHWNGKTSLQLKLRDIK